MRYEEQLLMELKAEITHRAERRRRLTRRLYAGGAVAALAAAAAFAVPLLTGTESPAYAVSKKSDGTIGVEIREFKDADRLEQDLREAGVRADVTYMGSGKMCAKNRGEIRTLPDDAIRMRQGGLDIDPRLVDENSTLVLEFAGNDRADDTTPAPRTWWVLATLQIAGEVGPCTVIEDPTWDDPGGPEGRPPAGS
ncbi:hypothetical protein HII36_02685 [Nonomuraea sp. NN258]|uniref:hypothetical protein n=1 Tax=Nonomuraea antri TaxID=2730852 RepID=UPI001569F02B|nr:hypothetical protein [Nonomuraea antri]NRQ30745.1 hypothetical protein [Nonomuraea antri]